jgi:hypothetical protein
MYSSIGFLIDVFAGLAEFLDTLLIRFYLNINLKKDLLKSTRENTLFTRENTLFFKHL